MLKRTMTKVPVAQSLVRRLEQLVTSVRFPGSRRYWDRRYRCGGTSGAGSQGRIAEFKAEVLNRFVADNRVQSVVEHGCGDGSQLRLARYPRYLGLDVSSHAITLCRTRFRGDDTKEFRHVDQYRGERCDLALSIDVIFHLVEDDVYHRYMERLFDSAERFVIIYSSNTEERISPYAPHVRHRRFGSWVAANAPGWLLEACVSNAFPYVDEASEGSFADFFVYRRG